ncbi:sigma-54 dependent transcriptional regulator [Barnesiella propionica]|uniref:sigma-54-dependent transcriptional regulator n=1 Tax=Barnesiella propionica TaxID=2981781 RepID=UPI0011C7B9B7|nr:sigma-54 dependent transcriptional regulator [Barnesiella propionica]MCU6769659.1 sigma-54 dependent transcriptional regulator [Barnesiella propionica]
MDKVLIVDDEDQIRCLLARLLGLEGYEVYEAEDCKAALKKMDTISVDVALCDVFLPDGNGVDLVLQMKKKHPETEIILLTAHGNIPDGVQAIKNGAFDYITKGDDNNKIIPLIGRAMEQAKMNRQGGSGKQRNGQYSFESIIGKSAVMQESISLARKVSHTDVPVLLTGETGTGKEVFAQSIHMASPRSGRSFVAVNCSAFTKDLLESEMFGHKAGAFTGAMKEKKGLFEEADKGTIFLDEIGEMAYDLQAKLLRVLETGEYIKIGETKPTKVDARVIAATNRDLKKEIEAGNFREDLFYRLSVFCIHLPALREHIEDIPLLAGKYMEDFSARLGKKIPAVSDGFYRLLEQYEWKGNVRELRNVIERCLIVCDEGSLSEKDLPLDMRKSAGTITGDPWELASIERLHIGRVLQYTKGNKSEAARLLGIGLTTLYRKIEEYGIN